MSLSIGDTQFVTNRAITGFTAITSGSNYLTAPQVVITDTTLKKLWVSASSQGLALCSC